MIDLDELLRIQAAATPGPWWSGLYGEIYSKPLDDKYLGEISTDEDLEFIVAACNNAAAMAEEVKTLRKALVVMSVHLAGACKGKCGEFLFCKTCDLSNGRNCADNVLAWHLDRAKEAGK